MKTLANVINTPWGQVSQSPDGFVTIVATGAETYRWANRVSAKWPCSTLSGEPLEAALESNGDLVDLEGPEDLDGHEFDAYVSDILRRAGLKE